MSGPYRPTIIRHVNAKGQRVPAGTPGSKRIREKSKTYWGRVPDANGKPRPVALCDGAEGAEVMLAEMKQRARRAARGDGDPYEDHRKRPLSEHLEDFEAFLESKGNTASHVSLTVNRVSAAIEGCGFKRLADLNAGKVANWLSDRRKPKKSHDGDVVLGLGIVSSNHHLVALKSFGNWIVRDRRSPENPFAHLSRMNARVDVRHERRALSPEELSELIRATENSTTTFRGLDGTTRAILYGVATMTGLRASELGSLTRSSFDLTADTPTVTLEAGYSKHRREDVLPLHSVLTIRLRQWFTALDRQQDEQRVVLAFDRAVDAKPERLFPGTWSEKAAKMLRIDLDTAGIAYTTDDGIADFHSLRHTFISNLVSGGVHPKLAQQLARHSTITLTMDRYSHVGLLDMTAALESLPTVSTSEQQTLRATGTTEDAPKFGCTNGCTRPAEISRFQPKSTVTMSTESASGQERKNPQIPAENEGFEGVKAVGLEPTTYGLKVRCSTN